MITDLLCVESSCDVQIAAQRTQGTNGNSNGHANRSVRFGSCQRPRLFIPKIRSDLTIHLTQELPVVLLMSRLANGQICRAR
jgi:hypothetical protein